MITKTVSKRFEVTTSPVYGKVFAEIGDIIKVNNRDSEHYTIIKVRDLAISSRWMRKNWINAHCKDKIETDKNSNLPTGG